MNKIINQKGVSLVELLVTVVIFSIISIGIVSLMVNVMNYNTRLSREVRLREEADLVMANFLNYIYTSNSITNGPSDNIIEVRINETERVLLGFTPEGKAGISQIFHPEDPTPTDIIPIHNTQYLFTDTVSGKESTIRTIGNTVYVDLYIHDQRQEGMEGIQLQSRINFMRGE